MTQPRLSALFAPLALLAACSATLPRLPFSHVPKPTVVMGVDRAALIVGAPADSNSDAQWPKTEWWQSFGDEQLNALIERAVRVAPSMAAAQARVAAATAAAQTVNAEAAAHVTGYAETQRQRLSDSGLFPPRFLGFNWYSMTDLGLDLQFSPDFVSKRKAERRAATSGVSSSQAELVAAKLGIARAVAATYYGWQTDTARLLLVRERLALLEREQALAERRLGAELTRADELQQLELSRLALLDQLDSVGIAVQMRTIALAALLKERPDEVGALEARKLPVPATDLPATTSLDLMARRADLMAARARIDAAVANADVLRAGFLPNLNLRALLGVSSRELGNLLQAGSAAPQFSAALHLPIFDGGLARAHYAGAQAQLELAVADYNERLMNAAHEVNEAVALRESSRSLAALRLRQVAAAEVLQQLAESRLHAGLADARPSLAAARAVIEMRDLALVTDFARISADLELIHALGGGYGASDERRR